MADKLKNCNCLSVIEKQIQEQTGDPDAEIGYALLMGSPSLMTPRMVYTYRKKKKSGELVNKQTEGTLIPTYCPFCGNKYERPNA